MRLKDLFEENLIDIEPKDIKIENGKMLPNQFSNKVNTFSCFKLPKLTSLENCPQEIEGYFDCRLTSITSLEHSPKIIKENFYCDNTKITSLDHAPLKCKYFACNGNDIKSLKGIGRTYLKECKKIYLPNSIKSNILGLCRVNKLKYITLYDDDNDNRIKFSKLYDAIEIIKNYLGTDGEKCAEELRQNGFSDYAKF